MGTPCGCKYLFPSMVPDIGSITYFHLLSIPLSTLEGFMMYMQLGPGGISVGTRSLVTQDEGGGMTNLLCLGMMSG